MISVNSYIDFFISGEIYRLDYGCFDRISLMSNKAIYYSFSGKIVKAYDNRNH